MKVPMAFFTDDRKKFFYNLYGNRKDLKEACGLERKRSDGGFRLPDFSLLQSYSNQCSMELKQKQE